jgi:hydrogenase maturation protease
MPPDGPFRRAGILGIGSLLSGDDGVGPHFVRRLLWRYAFPPSVVVEDIGTPGPGLLYAMEGLDLVVFVDALRAGRPGCLHRLGADAFETHSGIRLGPHDAGLRDAVALNALAGDGPTEVVLWGVVTKRVGPGTQLSPVVEAAMPALEAAVLGELRRWRLPAPHLSVHSQGFPNLPKLAPLPL